MRADNSSTITANETVNISTTGGSLASGIVASTNSLIELNNKTKVSTLGLNSRALWATVGSTINVNDSLSAETSGGGAHGLLALVDSTIRVNAGGDVTTRGDNANGFFALGANSLVSATNVNVTTNGAAAHGIRASEGGVVRAVGGNVAANGVDSNGAFASTGSTVALTNVVARSTGVGLRAAGASSITVSGGEITTTGIDSNGILAQDGSSVTVANSQVITQGANAAGIASTFIDANRVSTVSVSNSTVRSTQGDLVHSEGGALNVRLDRVSTSNGRAVLNTLDDAAGNHGTVNFSALNTVLNGDVIAAANNIANVSLAASSLTGAAYNATSIALDTNSAWNMTASSTVSNSVTNAGTIVFAAPVAGIFKTLTTTNYIGINGKAVLNTFLGADASPSDRIVINGGAATGQTALVINNAGGPGALTTDGVKVVRALNGGATTINAFFLGNGDFVTEDGQNAKIAGAFAYTLHRSAVTRGTDVYGEDETADDWYLRSVLVTPEPVPVPVRRLNPGVPIYEAYPATLLILNRLPTMAQRTGNRYWREQAPAQTMFCKDPAQNFKCTPNVEQNAYYQDGVTTIVGGNSVWGRIEGLHGRQKPDVTTSLTDYDYNLWKLQAGVDGQFYESDAGKLIGGLTAHYGRVSTDVSSIFGRGRIDTKGYGFGGTLTWYGTNEVYLDAQGQLTWFNSDLYSDTLRNSLANGNKGSGYALSLEGGKRITLNESWTLTPQAQLTWSSVRFDSFTDPFDARVSRDNGDSLKGRLGLAVGREHSWKDNADQISRTQVYGIVNLSNEFLNGTRVDVSGEKFVSRADRPTGGIGLGGIYSWANDKYALSGEINADTGLKNFSRSYEIGGTLGLRIKF